MNSTKVKTIKAIVSACITGLLYYFGIVAVPIIIIVIAMIIGYVTDMMSAWFNVELSSKKGVFGIVKRVSYLGLVCVRM